MAILHIARCARYMAANKLFSSGPKEDPRFRVCRIYVGRRMIAAGHVNNARYLEVAEFARWRSFYRMDALMRPSRHRRILPPGYNLNGGTDDSMAAAAVGGGATTATTTMQPDEATATKPSTKVLSRHKQNLTQVTKSRAPYVFVVASTHCHYIRPIFNPGFVRVETALLGLVPGGRSFWTQQRIFNAENQLCAQLLIRASMIQFKTGRGVPIKEAFLLSEFGDLMLQQQYDQMMHEKEPKVETDAEKESAPSNKTSSEDSATVTLDPKKAPLGTAELDEAYRKMCRRQFVFGEVELSDAAIARLAPGMAGRHDYLAAYDSAERSQRAALKNVRPVRATAERTAVEALRLELTSALAE
jgi:acyl-CoA thioesterase FadM